MRASPSVAYDHHLLVVCIHGHKQQVVDAAEVLDLALVLQVGRVLGDLHVVHLLLDCKFCVINRMGPGPGFFLPGF